MNKYNCNYTSWEFLEIFHDIIQRKGNKSLKMCAYHFDGGIAGVEGNAVVAVEFGLLVIPLGLEAVALLANDQGCHN